MHGHSFVMHSRFINQNNIKAQKRLLQSEQTLSNKHADAINIIKTAK
jgi:hypothetical protein